MVKTLLHMDNCIHVITYYTLVILKNNRIYNFLYVSLYWRYYKPWLLSIKNVVYVCKLDGYVITYPLSIVYKIQYIYVKKENLCIIASLCDIHSEIFAEGVFFKSTVHIPATKLGIRWYLFLPLMERLPLRIRDTIP